MGVHDPVTLDNLTVTDYRMRDSHRKIAISVSSPVIDPDARGTQEVYSFTSQGAATVTQAKVPPVRIELDPCLTNFTVDADATAKLNAGSIWMRENGFERVEWKIRSATVDNIDEPTLITLTCERVDDPMISATFTFTT